MSTNITNVFTCIRYIRKYFFSEINYSNAIYRQNNFVNLQHDYVNMWLIFVNMQLIYIT